MSDEAGSQSDQSRTADQADILDQISESMVTSSFCQRQFLPHGSFCQILSRQRIDVALPGAPPELVDFIEVKARKVFATVTWATRKSGENLVKVMRPFLHRLDDEMLYHEVKPQCKYVSGHKCSHSTAFNLLHESSWSRVSVQAFYNDRWCFHAPVFLTTHLQHTLTSMTILPFQPNDEECSERPNGGFGMVSKATIHREHQKLTTVCVQYHS